MPHQLNTSPNYQSRPYIEITDFIPWHRKSGNALGFFKVRVAYPDGNTKDFEDLKLCQNGSGKPFLSEPQDRQNDHYIKRYAISDFSLRKQIERVLLDRYEVERPGQLALALGVTA